MGSLVVDVILTNHLFFEEVGTVVSFLPYKFSELLDMVFGKLP